MERAQDQLTKIAEAQRNALLAKNDYNTSKEYSAVNKDALSDGDEKGKGELNGSIGSATDKTEKTKLVVKNIFTPEKEYLKFDVPLNY
jgi:hypothetical protein